MVGRSVSWLDKIERGERALLRLPMLERVAEVLGLDLHRVAALVRLHEGERALEYAAGIDVHDLATLPPERRVNYLLDLTEAYTLAGQCQQAAHCLGQAERVAPEEVRCRPLAHGLLRSLLNSTSGEPGRVVRQMAIRAGVTA